MGLKNIGIIFIIGLLGTAYAPRNEDCQGGCDFCDFWRNECYECSEGWTRSKVDSKLCVKCATNFCANCVQDANVCRQCSIGTFAIVRFNPLATIVSCEPCHTANCIDCTNKIGVCEKCDSLYELNDAKDDCKVTKKSYLTLIIIASVIVLLIIIFFFTSFCWKADTTKKCEVCNECSTLCTVCVCVSCDFKGLCDCCSTCQLECFCKMIGDLCSSCSCLLRC